jgi:hypothetical protein
LLINSLSMILTTQPLGAWIGSFIGIAGAPFGAIAGTIPVAVILGVIGLLSADHVASWNQTQKSGPEFAVVADSGTKVGGSLGFIAGASAGAWIGSGFGLALGPVGLVAGTIPGGVFGGIIGLLLGAKIGQNSSLDLKRFVRKLFNE